MPDELTPIPWKTKKVIDAHTHCRGDEPVSHYLKNVTLVNHTGGIVLTWNGVVTPATPRESRFGKELQSQPDRLFYIFGGLDHDAEQVAKNDGRYLAPQVPALLAAGFDGLKMMEGSPYYKKPLPHPLDHEYYRPFWDAAEEHGLPITIHLANPLECWINNTDPEMYGNAEPQEEYFRQAEAVLAAHPRLKIIFAHFMYLGPQLKRLGNLFSRYPGLHVDLAMGHEYMYYLSDDPVQAREFFIRWEDRILYGTDVSDRNSHKLARAKADQVRLFLETDATFVSQATEIVGKPPVRDSNGRVELHGLNLPQGTLNKILYGNVERLLGPAPKKLQ